MLQDPDLAFLKERGITYELAVDRRTLNVVLADYELPSGFDTSRVDLLLRLSTDFPDVKPDMFWVSPPIRLASGALAPASSTMESHLGRTWQRFSRHLRPDQWRPGVDDLRTWLAMIDQMLRRDAGR